MRCLKIESAIGVTIALLSVPCLTKTHGHHISHLNLLERSHNHHSHHKKIQASPKTEVNNETTGDLQKRGTCTFPHDAGLVAVTPGSKNAGWAMSPDQSCKPGSYCPYACPPGQVMAQWNPHATTYTYPQSMDGGLYCDDNGEIKKPFPEKPYCMPGTGAIGAHNKAGKGVSFCQTVLPGNEAMLIPTHVESWTELAVPDTEYWASTAAHYYINPPGVGVEDACVWGDESKPVGNWSPYVAGANTDSLGNTFVKVGWNPIYTGSRLASSPPDFGVKVVCDRGTCHGTPCSIDLSSHRVGSILSADQSVGAGGASFCVVTVPKGSKANIVVFSNGQADKPDAPESAPSSSAPVTTSPSHIGLFSLKAEVQQPSLASSAATTSTTISHSSAISVASPTLANIVQPLSVLETKSAEPTTVNAPGILLQSKNATVPAHPSVVAPVNVAPSASIPVESTSQAPNPRSTSSVFGFLVMFVTAVFVL